MAPPSATHTDEVTDSNGHNNEKLATPVTHEPGVSKDKALKREGQIAFPKPPIFEDKYKEREYLKGRLALAFRIFAKNGFDEGVAGHITLRVRAHSSFYLNPSETSTTDRILTDDLKIGPCRSHLFLGEPLWRCLAHHQSLRSDPGGP